jgi:hypothetical protein
VKGLNYIHISVTVPIQTTLEQGDALIPLLLNFVLEHFIEKVYGNQEGLGTHQFKIQDDDYDSSLLDKNINITQILLDVNEEVGLEINTDTTTYFHNSSPNCRQIHNIKMGSSLKMWQRSDTWE